MSVEYRFEHRRRTELPPMVHKRSLCWLYFTLFVLLQAGIVAWLYFSGYLTPVGATEGMQALSLRGKVEEQDRLLGQQSAEITRLEQQLAAAKRTEAIQAASNEGLQAKLILAETDLAESRDRLLLYEEILSPAAANRGLNVQHLDIKRLLIDAQGKKLAHDRHYQYHLILTNVRGETAQVEGEFNLRLEGEQQGKLSTLQLKDIVIADGDGQLSVQTDKVFSFKHYQGLEGHIELPEGFRPQRVMVDLMPVSGKKVQRQYDWKAFTSAK